MSEKTIEAMKKILEEKKKKQLKDQKDYNPFKKIGSTQGPKVNRKFGGSNNKV